MRTISTPQLFLDFFPKPTKETSKFHAKYEAISKLLDESPEILEPIHNDLSQPLKYLKSNRVGNRRATYSSQQLLRILLVMNIESLSYREVAIRVDDSNYLRHFTRIFDSKMMNFSTINKLCNSISTKSWETVNQLLAEHAVKNGLISGEALRMDTTAVETNIHYPTDSSLLFDSYKVLGRLISRARKIDPTLVGKRRVYVKKAKKLYTKVARIAGSKKNEQELISLYIGLIYMVETICELANEVSLAVAKRLETQNICSTEKAKLSSMIERLNHFLGLAGKVVNQSTKRVLQGEKVSSADKIYSIFEEHTELLKRGKAGKAIEFGHMIQLEQVSQKFITNYKVFPNRPAEPELLFESLEKHRKLFKSNPKVLTADKGYYSSAIVEKLRESVDLVAIAKKGMRTAEEKETEHCDEFKLAQSFRAGIEGSISFLKRRLGLWRCLNKGWKQYCSTIGMTIFAHNLLKLVST